MRRTTGPADSFAVSSIVAGNNSRNLDSSFYNNYPAEYNLSNIVVVGASTSSAGLASYSNYGSVTVDVVAPGSSVLSTLPGNRYGYLSGTSMATPMVTGAAALLLAANRSLTAAQLKQRLIAGADESTALNNRSVSDGELNVNNALLARSGTNLASLASTATTTAGGGGFIVIARHDTTFLSTGAGLSSSDDAETLGSWWRRGRT